MHPAGQRDCLANVLGAQLVAMMRSLHSAQCSPPCPESRKQANAYLADAESGIKAYFSEPEAQRASQFLYTWKTRAWLRGCRTHEKSEPFANKRPPLPGPLLQRRRGGCRLIYSISSF